MFRIGKTSKASVIHQSASVKYMEIAQKVCLQYHRKSQTGQGNSGQYSMIISTVAESLQNAAAKSPEFDELPASELEYVAHGLTKQFLDALDIAERLRNIVNPSTGAQIAIDRARHKPHNVINNVVSAIMPDNAIDISDHDMIYEGHVSENTKPNDGDGSI